MITFCSGKKCQSVGVTGSFVLRSDRRHHCRLGLLFRSAQWRCGSWCGRAENAAVLSVWRHCEHSESNAISRTGAWYRVQSHGQVRGIEYNLTDRCVVSGTIPLAGACRRARGVE